MGCTSSREKTPTSGKGAKNNAPNRKGKGKAGKGAKDEGASSVRMDVSDRKAKNPMKGGGGGGKNGKKKDLTSPTSPNMSSSGRKFSDSHLGNSSRASKGKMSGEQRRESDLSSISSESAGEADHNLEDSNSEQQQPTVATPGAVQQNLNAKETHPSKRLQETMSDHSGTQSRATPPSRKLTAAAIQELQSPSPSDNPLDPSSRHTQPGKIAPEPRVNSLEFVEVSDEALAVALGTQGALPVRDSDVHSPGSQAGSVHNEWMYQLAALEKDYEERMSQRSGSFASRGSASSDLEEFEAPVEPGHESPQAALHLE